MVVQGFTITFILGIPCLARYICCCLNPPVEACFIKPEDEDVIFVTTADGGGLDGERAPAAVGEDVVNPIKSSSSSSSVASLRSVPSASSLTV